MRVCVRENWEQKKWSKEQDKGAQVHTAIMALVTPESETAMGADAKSAKVREGDKASKRSNQAKREGKERGRGREPRVEL